MSNVIEFLIRGRDEYTAAFSKLNTQLGAMKKAYAAVAGAVGLYAGINLVKQSLNTAEAMAVAGQKAGMTTEKFSALAWAAQQSNVGVGELEMGMRFLNRALASDDTPASKALAKLGITAKTGEEALYKLADAFAASKDNADKVRVAVDVFGRSGTSMIPMLNQGSEAIKQMMRDADALGMVISDDFAASADQLNDNLATMSALIKGGVNKAMIEMSPVLETLSGQYIQWAKDTHGVTTGSQVLATGLKLVVSVGLVVVETFRVAGETLGAFAAGIAALARGEFSAAIDLFKTKVEFNAKRISDVWDESAQSMAAVEFRRMKALRDSGESLATHKEANEDAAKATKQLHDDIRDGTIALERQLAFWGMSAEQIKVYELAIKAAGDEGLRPFVQRAQEAVDKLEYMRSLQKFIADEQGTFTAPIEESIGKMVNHAETANSVFYETSRQLKEHFAEMGNEVFQMSTSIALASITAVRGIGDAFAATVIEGRSLAAGLEMVAKNVLKTVLSTLIQIGVQRLILSMLDLGATKMEASSKIGAGLGEVYVNSFASAAAIPMIGWMIAPGVAAANAAAAAAGTTASMAVGSGIGAAGVAHGGLDFVPREQTYLLDRGERVLSPRQNEDLTSFINGDAGGQGMVIQNLNIHILENATGADTFTRMDKVQLRNTLGKPIIDALNEMYRLGVRPNFAMQGK